MYHAPDMSTDTNYQSYWGVDGLTIINQVFSPENPLKYSDILKFSICTNTLVEDTYVVGGKEDCIDAVRGENYIIRRCVLHPNGRNGITLKGNLKRAFIRDVEFETHGSECDIELGQHTIYSNFFGTNQKTEAVVIENTNSKSGKPLIVKVWNADKPVVINSNVKIQVVPKILVKLYFALRWIQIHIIGKIFKKK